MEPEETLLLGLGYNNLQAKILYTLIKHGPMTADVLSKEAYVTKTRVYQILKGFIEDGKVFASRSRPHGYSVPQSLIENLRKDLIMISNKLASQLTKEGDVFTEDFKEKVKITFEKEGYSIHPFPDLRFLVPFIIYSKNIFSFIADGDFRLACIVIDKVNEDFFNKFIDAMPSSMVISEIVRATEESECLLPLIIIDPDLSSNKKISAWFNAGMEELKKYKIEFRKGFQGTPLFLVNDPVKSVVDITQQLSDRYQMVYQLEINLRKSMDKVDQNLLKCESFYQFIQDQFESGKRTFYPPYVKQKLESIKKPIKEIAERERKNKDLVKEEYIFKYVQIKELLKNIEARNFLPSPDTITKLINDLVLIEEELAPILFEFNKLKKNIGDYLFIREGKINPFIITVPEEKDGFVANQEKIKESFSNFCSAIPNRATPITHFIRGKEGIGKTHLIKYVLKKSAESEKLYFFYVSCELKQEFIQNLSYQMIDALQSDKNLDTNDLILRYKLGYCNDVEEFSLLLMNIQELISTKGYKGIILSIDEFENCIETQGTSYFHIKNLKKILEQAINRFGIFISCREDNFNELKQKLGYLDIESMTDAIIPLSKPNIKEMIKKKCETWGSPMLNISDEALDVILQKTESNTRAVIKYCRELYSISEKKQITDKDVIALQLPIFKKTEQKIK